MPCDEIDDVYFDKPYYLAPDKMGADAFRLLRYRGGYDRDAGLRMDHLLLNPSLAGQLRSAGVDVETRVWQKPSDHAPAWIEIGS